MIKISLRYPNNGSGRFDIDYYVITHAPWVRRLMGDALKGFEIEQRVYGREPGSDPSYVAVAQLYFDPVEHFKFAYGANPAEIQSDIPNYTNIQPVMQVSRVMGSNLPRVG